LSAENPDQAEELPAEEEVRPAMHMASAVAEIEAHYVSGLVRETILRCRLLTVDLCSMPHFCITPTCALCLTTAL
jgi:hypothetical protein